MRSSARLIGAFADVRAASTIAALRPLFLDTARRLGLADFDAAAVKSAHPRELTQKLASHLYALVDEDGTPARGRREIRVPTRRRARDVGDLRTSR